VVEVMATFLRVTEVILALVSDKAEQSLPLQSPT
jgi:hypothetical protein